MTHSEAIFLALRKFAEFRIKHKDKHVQLEYVPELQMYCVLCVYGFHKSFYDGKWHNDPLIDYYEVFADQDDFGKEKEQNDDVIKRIFLPSCGNEKVSEKLLPDTQCHVAATVQVSRSKGGQGN